MNQIHHLRSRRAASNSGAAASPASRPGRQLQGLRPARAHRDIDLLCVADDFSAVDALLDDHPLFREVPRKRSAHTRAFELEGVLVELFLVERDNNGYRTTFWGRVRHDWPPAVLSSASQLPVASVAALTGHRELGTLRREKEQRQQPC